MESNKNKSVKKENINSIDKVIKRGVAEINIKMFIFAFLALVLACVIPYIVKIIDIIILLFVGINSTETRGSYSFEEVLSQDFNQPMNLAYIMVATYILYIIVYGVWYSHFIRQDNSDKNDTSSTADISSDNNLKQTLMYWLVKLFKSPLAYLLIIDGFAGQVMVDSVLNLCRSYFPDAFKEYDAIVSSAVGASSSLAMLFAVFILAPIGEELLFRGLIQGYLRRAVNDSPIAVVILAQGFCFGVYHGNIIQCIYAVILGSLLGLIAYKAGSILPCILFHMSLNISVSFVSEAWFEYTSGCIITGIISTVVFNITMLLVYKLFHRDQADTTEA